MDDERESLAATVRWREDVRAETDRAAQAEIEAREDENFRLHRALAETINERESLRRLLARAQTELQEVAAWAHNLSTLLHEIHGATAEEDSGRDWPNATRIAEELDYFKTALVLVRNKLLDGEVGAAYVLAQGALKRRAREAT